MRSLKLLTCVIIAAAAALLPSCGQQRPDSTPKEDTTAATPPIAQEEDTALQNTTDEDTSQYATVYLVIADTGQDYYALRAKMQHIATAQNWTIDTMGRYYNKKKKEIVLPDDDEDELYRGEYFPRRNPSTTLSLEYYHSYNDASTAKNIALLAAICADEPEATALLSKLKADAPGAFIYQARLYMGCMH